MTHRLGIVILNYLNWTDTIELVDSIMNQSFQNFEVIIIDNDSDNESFEILSKKNQKNQKITILKLNTNMGFAKGNNEGISYFKKRGIFKVLVLNNDTILTEKKYLEKLMEIEYGENIGAIGTKIIGSDGINQNPIQNVRVGFFNSAKSLITKIIKVSLPKKIRWKLLTYKHRYKSKSEINKELLSGCESETEKIFLHGSAIFFTENYLKISDGFYSETFLFFEENILAIIFKRLNLKFLYYPKISLYHKEDQASLLAWDNNDDKKDRYTIESIKKSFKVILINKKRLKSILQKNI